MFIFVVWKRKGKKRAHFTRFPNNESTPPTLSTNLSTGRAKIGGQQDRSLAQQSLQKRFHVYPRGYRRIGRQEPLQAGKHAPRKSRWRLARCRCNVTKSPADERVQLALLEGGESDFLLRLDRIFRVRIRFTRRIKIKGSRLKYI